MGKLNVTLSIPDPSRFYDVVKAAQENGLRVEKSFAPLGIATGEVDRRSLEALRALPGVGDVEEEHTFQIPRPV